MVRVLISGLQVNRRGGVVPRLAGFTNHASLYIPAFHFCYYVSAQTARRHSSGLWKWLIQNYLGSLVGFVRPLPVSHKRDQKNWTFFKWKVGAKSQILHFFPKRLGKKEPGYLGNPLAIPLFVFQGRAYTSDTQI